MLMLQQHYVAGHNMSGAKLLHRDNKVVFDLELGLVHLDVCNQERGYRIINLGSRENNILKLLVNKSGVLVTKREILDSIWKDRVVCDNIVAVSMSNIRKVIRQFDDKCSCLLTISKKGYLFYPHRSGLYLDNGQERGEHVPIK